MNNILFTILKERITDRWIKVFLLHAVNFDILFFIHSTDKPSKPNIQGNLNSMVDSHSELTCSSFSTTAPDYYARLRPLSHTWYVNNTKLYGETNETLRLRVTRNHKYNRYSCTAREILESDRSDPVRINPLCKKVLKSKGYAIRWFWMNLIKELFETFIYLHNWPFNRLKK